MRLRFSAALVAPLAVACMVGGAAPAVAATSEAEALTTAVAQATPNGLTTGPLVASSAGRAEYSRVQSVFYSGEVTPGGPKSSAPTYAFVMTNGSTFEPNVPTPRGRSLPPERYLGLGVDAATGLVTQAYFGLTAPPIAKIGPVVTIDITRNQATAASTTCNVDALLVAALRRKHFGARLASAEHSLGVCKARHR